MDEVEARRVILKACYKLLTIWQRRIDEGPEGYEVYVQPSIDELEKAIRVIYG